MQNIFLINLIFIFGLSACVTNVSQQKPFIKSIKKDVFLVDRCVIKEYLYSSWHGRKFYTLLNENGEPTKLYRGEPLIPRKPIKIIHSGSSTHKLYNSEELKERIYILSTEVDEQKEKAKAFKETGFQNFGANRYYYLEKGKKLEIIKVENSNFYNDQGFTAKGRVFIDEKQEYVDFQYMWGYGDSIKRAPWEDENIEEERYVGFSGKKFEE